MLIYPHRRDQRPNVEGNIISWRAKRLSVATFKVHCDAHTKETEEACRQKCILLYIYGEGVLRPSMKDSKSGNDFYKCSIKSRRMK